MRTRYFPRAAALANVPVVYAVLYGFKTMLPNVPFRLGFPNGLMSESMVIRAFLSTSPPLRKAPERLLPFGRFSSHILSCISQT